MLAHPGQPLSEEERTVQDRINAEITGLEAEITRFVNQETREQESARVANRQYGRSLMSRAGSRTGD